MSKNLINEIKKTNEYRDSLAWKIKKIREKWMIQEKERKELLKTLSEDEIVAIEKKRVEKSSFEAQEMLNKQKNTQEYRENKENYQKHKEIIKKLSELMNISIQEAQDIVKNLDTITNGNDQLIKRFIQSVSNMLKWKTSLAKKIEKTTKEKELLEKKIQEIQGKSQLSQWEKEKLLQHIGEDEIAIINKLRSGKSEEEIKKFLENEKERIEKLEKIYQEQQIIVKHISELLDISENDVINVLKYLNIEVEVEEEKETTKKKEEKEISKKEKTPQENAVKNFLKKAISNITDKKKKIIITASLVLALLWAWHIWTKAYINHQEKEKQETIAENKILSIDTVKIPGYQEKNDTLTVRKFLDTNRLSMDPQTIEVIPYPWEKINTYSDIRWHFIKDKEKVIFNAKDRNSSIIEIPWADIKSFKVLDQWQWYTYAKDKNNVYMITSDTIQLTENSYQFAGEKLIIIENADPATFTPIKESYYAKDKNNVFYEGKKILWGDAASFEYIGWATIAKDKNHVYNKGNIVNNIDAKTFVCIDKRWYLFTDKNWVYDGTTFLKWIDRYTAKRIGKNTIKDKNWIHRI